MQKTNHTKNAKKKPIDMGFWLLVLMAMLLGYYALYGVNNGTEITYAEAKQLFHQEKVEYFELADTTLMMEIRDAQVSDGRSVVRCEVPGVEIFTGDAVCCL